MKHYLGRYEACTANLLMNYEIDDIRDVERDDFSCQQ